MKEKSLFILLATALICTVSCNKHQIIDQPEDPEQDGEYTIEIQGTGLTKGISSVDIDLANLAYSSSRNITAQLKRRSGSSWVAVTSGVVYSWSASSSDSQKFSGSGTSKQTCTVTAKSKGSGTINVSASISGSTVASKGIPVNVSDNRSIHWTGAVSKLMSGDVGTAVLNSNFSNNVTVSSNDGSFLVGLSAQSLGTSVSVSFTTGMTATIYCKYTGTEGKNITVTGSSSQSDCSKAEFSVDVLDPHWKHATLTEMQDLYLDNVYNLGSSSSLSRSQMLAKPWKDFNDLWGVHDFDAFSLAEFFIDMDYQMDSDVLKEFYESGYPYSACTPYLGYNGNQLISMYRQRLGLD